MNMRRVGMLAVAAGAVGVGAIASTGTSNAQEVIAVAEMQDGTGQVIGEVQFRMQNQRVIGEIEIQLPATSSRFHGFHLHANADPSNGVGCVGPTFASADGHWNPTQAGHGNHAGDLPPLVLGHDGLSRAEFDVGHFTPGDLPGLAVIVHAGPDNLGNIPTRYTTTAGAGPDSTTLATGDAGARYACGVIEPRGR